MTRHSFTLTELLVVIAIIVILAGILISGAGYAARRADEAKAKATMLEFDTALDKFKSDKGYYPICKNGAEVEFKFYNINEDKSGKPDVYQLALVLGSKENPFYDKKTGHDYMSVVEVSEIAGTKNENQPKEKLLDPWGNAFYYKCPGTHNKTSYDLWSYGPDGKSSSDDERLDDVTNWGTAQ